MRVSDHIFLISTRAREIHLTARVFFAMALNCLSPAICTLNLRSCLLTLIPNVCSLRANSRQCLIVGVIKQLGETFCLANQNISAKSQSGLPSLPRCRFPNRRLATQYCRCPFQVRSARGKVNC